jgi:hypothetical protein
MGDHCFRSTLEGLGKFSGNPVSQDLLQKKHQRA